MSSIIFLIIDIYRERIIHIQKKENQDIKYLCSNGTRKSLNKRQIISG